MLESRGGDQLPTVGGAGGAAARRQEQEHVRELHDERGRRARRRRRPRRAVALQAVRRHAVAVDAGGRNEQQLAMVVGTATAAEQRATVVDEQPVGLTAAGGRGTAVGAGADGGTQFGGRGSATDDQGARGGGGAAVQADAEAHRQREEAYAAARGATEAVSGVQRRTRRSNGQAQQRPYCIYMFKLFCR